MREAPDHTGDARPIVRAIYATYLKLAIGVLITGVLLILGGEIVAARSTSLVEIVATFAARLGVALTAFAIPLIAVCWFGRETTKHFFFTEQRLPVRYRMIAWFVVVTVAVLFIGALWFTISRGLTTW